MEGEFIVHSNEEPINRGGSVVSVSSRGSTKSAQMVYDDNSTISSTGSYQLQYSYDWHPGSVSSGISLTGSGTLLSWGSQSTPLESGPTLTQQAPPPQYVRVENEITQNRHPPRRPIKSRSDLPQLINAFHPPKEEVREIDEEACGVLTSSNTKDDGSLKPSSGADKAKDTTNCTDDISWSELEKIAKHKLQKQFDENLPLHRITKCKRFIAFLRSLWNVFCKLCGAFVLPLCIMFTAGFLIDHQREALLTMYAIEVFAGIVYLIVNFVSCLRRRKNRENLENDIIV